MITFKDIKIIINHCMLSSLSVKNRDSKLRFMNQRSSNQENYEEACSPANITEPTKEHQKYTKNDKHTDV